MFSKYIKKFRYRTNEFSLRSGFIEETYTNYNGLNKRVCYWKYTLTAYFQPKPGEKLGLYFSHTVFDFFAIIIAALDLRLKITVEHDNDVDYVLHTLPEKDLEKFRLTKKPMYHHFDIADDFLPKNCEVDSVGLPTDIAIDNFTQAQVLDICIPYDKVEGSVLHTRYRKNKELLYFFFPSVFAMNTSLHVASGYNDIENGLDKLLKIPQKIEIDNVCFSECHIAHKFFRGLDCKHKPEIWTFDPELLKIDLDTTYDQKIKGIEFDCEKFTNLAYTYKIEGRFYVDYAYQKLYFAPVDPIEKTIGEIKHKVLEQMLQSYGIDLNIDKFAHVGYMESEYDSIEHFRNMS